MKRYFVFLVVFGAYFLFVNKDYFFNSGDTYKFTEMSSLNKGLTYNVWEISILSAYKFAGQKVRFATILDKNARGGSGFYGIRRDEANLLYADAIHFIPGNLKFANEEKPRATWSKNIFGNEGHGLLTEPDRTLRSQYVTNKDGWIQTDYLNLRSMFSDDELILAPALNKNQISDQCHIDPTCANDFQVRKVLYKIDFIKSCPVQVNHKYDKHNIYRRKAIGVKSVEIKSKIIISKPDCYSVEDETVKTLLAHDGWPNNFATETQILDFKHDEQIVIRKSIATSKLRH